MKKEVEGNPQTKQEENRISFLLKEAIPVSQIDRKKYVSDITFFYSTIFKKKLEHFIGEELFELSIRGRTEAHYNMIRANINSFTQINTWMEKMTNEHFGNLEEIRNSFEDNNKIINNIKNKYGNN